MLRITAMALQRTTNSTISTPQKLTTPSISLKREREREREREGRGVWVGSQYGGVSLGRTNIPGPK
jgi:hypothetical protein